jgi:hypothetical protein
MGGVLDLLSSYDHPVEAYQGLEHATKPSLSDQIGAKLQHAAAVY